MEHCTPAFPVMTKKKQQQQQKKSFPPSSAFKPSVVDIFYQMEENMRRAGKRDAVNTGEFFFRKSLVPEDEDEEVESDSAATSKSHDHEYTLMSIDTIVNGKVSCMELRRSSVSISPFSPTYLSSPFPTPLPPFPPSLPSHLIPPSLPPFPSPD